MQEPSPISILRMLNAARMQFRRWDEGPSFGIALHVQECMNTLRRLQVVHTVMLAKFVCL